MATQIGEKLYKTRETVRRTVRVRYPADQGRIVLRTESDWDRDVEPIALSEDGTTWTYSVEADQPFLYFKPCLVRGSERHWAVGDNSLLLMSEPDRRVSHPFFFSPDRGRFSDLLTLDSAILGRQHRLRVLLPPGYDENTLASYPIAFMQDGQNLFFPDEAFLGRDWAVDESSAVLRAMSAVEDMIVVGVHSGDRMVEYTKPGYELYARSLAEEVVPLAEARLRTGKHRRFRSVWGSSLGGVVSFYTVWQHPDVFGAGVCMSSTFSHRDDLMDRVLAEKRPNVGFYLDSGWPGDNFEVTMGMAMALIARGWRFGDDLLHLCFPYAEHDEAAWGTRLHLPLQFLNGSVARASRLDSPVLGDDPWSRDCGKVSDG
jgi:predicted alpha/beta superfamily hydrolase